MRRSKPIQRVFKPYCVACKDHHWGICFTLNQQRYEKD